ncbi:MAG TPA: PKD domain-containing protein [Chitinophagaceae bacterium]|nr:PKD domain-containing protein [Chitinophagaceae bacterium]
MITPVESFTFYPQINTSGALYQWNFGDGTTSTLASPTHTFSGGGVRNVRLTLQYGGSTDSIVNPILTDYNSVCRTQFNVMIDTMSANAVVVTALSSALNHSWDFGDGQTGTGITDTNIYSASGAYTITLNSGSPSCSTSFKRHIGFGFLPVSNASYTYTTALNSLSTYSPRINNSACIITWKNKGATYRSYKNDSKLNQQGNVVLTIDSFEAYTPDSKGNPTLKIKGRVNTWLYNEANKNDSVKIVSNDLIFALAYPN